MPADCEMSDEWADLVRKAKFCQGELNMQQAMTLWQRAAEIAPLDHAGRLNYLICRRRLAPKEDYNADALELAKDAIETLYFNHFLVIAMLCSFEVGEMAVSADLATALARLVEEAERAGHANVWDLPGEPDFVSEEGVIEAKSGATIIDCLTTLIRVVPPALDGGRPIEELLKRYRAREDTMNRARLPVLPPKKAWWKFW